MSAEIFLLTKVYRGREHTDASFPPQGSSHHPYESPPLNSDEDHPRLAIPYYSTRKTNLHPIYVPANSHQLRPAPFNNEQNDVSNSERRIAPMAQLINQMRFIEEQYYNERKYQEELEYRVARGLFTMTKGSEAEDHHRIKQGEYSAIQQLFDNSLDTGETCTPSGTPTSQRLSQLSKGFLEEPDDKWERAFQNFESYTSLKLSGHRLEYWLTEHRKCYAACSMICSYEMAQTAV